MAQTPSWAPAITSVAWGAQLGRAVACRRFVAACLRVPGIAASNLAWRKAAASCRSPKLRHPLTRPVPAEENAGGGPPSYPRGRGLRFVHSIDHRQSTMTTAAVLSAMKERAAFPAFNRPSSIDNRQSLALRPQPLAPFSWRWCGWVRQATRRLLPSMPRRGWGGNGWFGRVQWR